MGNIINLSDLFLYGEARRRLEKNKIEFTDNEILRRSPELCREIIALMDYCENEGFTDMKCKSMRGKVGNSEDNF